MNYYKIKGLLKEYAYVIKEKDWKKSEIEHPDFPQMNAVCDIFNYYGIDNYIAEVPLTVFSELPANFIAMVHYNGSLDTALIEKVNENTIRISFYDHTIQINQEEFLKIWNGFVLLIDEKELLEVPKLEEKENNYETATFLFLGVILFLSIVFKYRFLNATTFSLVIVNGIGLYLSYWSVKTSLGFGNKKLFKLCSKIKNGSCNQVITSNQSIIFKQITYSDLSLVYFSFSFIIIFFIKQNPNLIYLNILFIPFSIFTILFAIYQQYFVIKKWCLLCLGISLLVVIQSIITILFLINKESLDTQNLVLLIFLFSLIFSIWYLIKPQFVKLSDLIFEKFQRGEIYKDKEVFTAYWNKKMALSKKDFDSLNPLQLNNSNSVNSITLILSPNCEYCKTEYKKLKDIMFYYQSKINFRVLFNFDNQEIENKIVTIIETLQGIRKEEGKITLALDDFLEKNYSPNKWLKKWSGNTTNNNKEITTNLNILNDNNITDAPCLLINNQLYPKEYKLEDIIYFLNHIIKTE